MLSVGQSKNPHWGRQWAMAYLAHAIKCHDKCVMEVEHHIVLLKSTRGRDESYPRRKGDVLFEGYKFL